MVPTPQFPGERPSSPGALRVSPGPPGNLPFDKPTCFSSTPPPQTPSSVLGRHPITLLTKRFQTPVEQRKTDVAGIGDSSPLPEMSYDKYDVADVSDDLSDLGSAEVKPPMNLK